jgi:hypothetical protein
MTTDDTQSLPVESEFSAVAKRHFKYKVGSKGPRTFNLRRVPGLATIFADSLQYPEEYDRPKTRADCQEGGTMHYRPCPWVGCAHNLYLDVSKLRSERYSLTLNRPELEPGDVPPHYSCTLDIADNGEVKGNILDTVAEALNISRERARQIEEGVLISVGQLLRGRGLTARNLLSEPE